MQGMPHLSRLPDLLAQLRLLHHKHPQHRSSRKKWHFLRHLLPHQHFLPTVHKILPTTKKMMQVNRPVFIPRSLAHVLQGGPLPNLTPYRQLLGALSEQHLLLGRLEPRWTKHFHPLLHPQVCRKLCFLPTTMNPKIRPFCKLPFCRLRPGDFPVLCLTLQHLLLPM